MRPADVPGLRLASQRIAGTAACADTCTDAGELVAHMGAMQAQDLDSALWAVGLRLPGTTLPDLHQAIANRRIVRTWLQRGTLHLAAGADLRWMLALLGPRNIAGAAGRQRQLELDDTVFASASKIIGKALGGGAAVSRTDLFALLEKKGIVCGGQRGIHILWRLAQDGLLCFAGHSGRQPSFVLLDAWLPAAAPLPRDEALARLAERYFTSHGPAMVADFAWWAGITLADAKRAVAACSLAQEDGYALAEGGQVAPRGVHLLPGFDEYLLGYKDRGAVLGAAHAPRIVPGGNGVFMPMLVVDGQIAGTWRYRDGAVDTDPFAPLKSAANKAVKAAAARYRAFRESAS